MSIERDSPQPPHIQTSSISVIVRPKQPLAIAASLIMTLGDYVYI